MSNARPMTIFDIAAVLTSAFAKAFTSPNTVAGFRRCGIEPFDPSLYDDDGEFLAASVTDRPPPADVVSSTDATTEEHAAVASDAPGPSHASSPNEVNMSVVVANTADT